VSTEDEGEVEYFGEDGVALDAPASHLGAVIDAGDGWDALDHELCMLPENDLANAKRLERRNSGKIYWTSEWGPGVWDGFRFDFEHGVSRAGQLAQAAAEAMLKRETGAFYDTQRRKGEDDKSWLPRARRFFGFCLQAGNNGRTESMLKQAERMLSRPLAQFDDDPDRLVLKNGTLYLPRNGSRPKFSKVHNPDHMVSRLALASFDPKARCPQFLAFLERVQPDPEMRAFLARLIGYCLTGHIGEQAYFIFHGKGGDGKSTFLNALQEVLGDYVANAAIETFLKHDKKGSDHSADIARLASGVRLVKAAEPEQGAKLAESVIKTITGGEPFPARAMYREPFEFVPSWKLIISCNRKPRITGGDRGIWRRTKVVPWPVSIPLDEMDRDLDAKLRRESSGILNWALTGWADWLERGLDPPAAAREATEEYRMNSDPFAAWFAMCLDQVDGASERAADLFDSYRGWVAESGFDAMKQTSFGRALSENGLQRKRSNGIAWAGVRLNVAGHEAQRAFELAKYEPQYGAGDHD
jgi:putative DNA primase/helicase